MANGLGDDRFATISAISGLDIDDDGRALVQSDWDQDGDLDLWISNRNAPRLRFFRNDSPSSNRFVQLELVGNGNDTNRNGYGARVKVVLKSASDKSSSNVEPNQIVKTLRAGEGFVSQSSHWLHFGLGESAEIEHIYVTWPNKELTTEDFGAVPANGRFRLEQGSGLAKKSSARTGELAITPSATKVPPDDMRHRIPLIYPLNVSAMGFFGFDGSPHDIDFDPKQVTLINLWSTTCKPCMQELTEFARRADELKSAGVRVIALSVDALESGQTDVTTAAKEMADRLKIPFEVGMAPAAVIEELHLLHDALITLDRPMPMPSSFLINGKGQLDTIYKGPVDVDTLLDDSRVGQLDILARFQRSAAFPGRMIEDEIVNSALVKSQAMVHYKRAKQLIANQMLDAAAKEYELLMQYWPESGSIVNDAAVLMLMRGNITEATMYLTRAMELKPDDPEIRFNLARTFEKLAKRDEATKLMEQSVAKFPEHANSHFMLGFLKFRAKDFDGAKACFANAIEYSPRHSQALFSLANLLINTGDFVTAKKHLLTALEISPNEPVILVALGKVYIYEKNWSEAERLLRLAVRKQPLFAEAQYQLGLALAAQNKFSEAQLFFEATLRLDGNFPGAREALQRTLSNSVSKN